MSEQTAAVGARTTLGRSRGCTKRSITSHAAQQGQAAARFEVLVLILIGALLIVGAVATSRPRVPSTTMAPVSVRSGETVWSLAAAHPVPGLTTAEVADLLVRTNGLEGRTVTPGETVLIPVEPPTTRLALR